MWIVLSEVDCYSVQFHAIVSQLGVNEKKVLGPCRISGYYPVSGYDLAVFFSYPVSCQIASVSD